MTGGFMSHSDSQIREIMEKLTLEEKCSLLSGSDFWHSQPVERLDIPAVMVSDGPHGLRKQDVEHSTGVNDSIQAVCFPAACATSASFDRKSYARLGSVLGDECQAQGVSTLLGPAINIKRSPLCGRNFEYISEDPYLAGELSATYINAVQEKHVGTSLKHFALNDQEYRRLTNSSDCDERTMREIYLKGFEIAVRKSQPATIMHSYNLINGTYAGENPWLISDVLRKEWGFKGLVMSDWGAVSDRIAGVKAGTDLEMPSSDGINDAKVLKAAKNDPELVKKIDECVFRILRWIYDFEDNRQQGEFDIEKHHKIAREIEEESIVLLKNDNILPLDPATAGKIAVIGEFAKKPRFQGGGSSHINTKTVSNAFDSLEAYGLKLSYAKGFSAEPPKDKDLLAKETAALADEALKVASGCDTILVFAGLPDSFESEGYDRKHMDLPEEQNELIKKLCATGKKVVVILHNGSPVTMPWVKDVNAILELYLGGEAVGEAAANVLTGRVNPSGKLAETFPLRLEDTPSFLNFANDKKHTVYTEGVFVGYRWYDARKMDVLFPFGFGLSYTSFEYSNLRLSKSSVSDGEKLTATVTVSNTGKIDGKEIVQLYVSDKTESTVRPKIELKGFDKVFVPAGKSVDVSFELDKSSFAWYSTDLQDWYAASGEYEIKVGPSSRDLPLSAPVKFTTSVKLPLEITLDTTCGDLLKDERTKGILNKVFEATTSEIENGGANADEAITEEMKINMMDAHPLRNVISWSHLSEEQAEKMMADLRRAVEK